MPLACLPALAKEQPLRQDGAGVGGMSTTDLEVRSSLVAGGKSTRSGDDGKGVSGPMLPPAKEETFFRAIDERRQSLAPMVPSLSPSRSTPPFTPPVYPTAALVVSPCSSRLF